MIPLEQMPGTATTWHRTVTAREYSWHFPALLQEPHRIRKSWRAYNPKTDISRQDQNINRGAVLRSVSCDRKPVVSNANTLKQEGRSCQPGPAESTSSLAQEEPSCMENCIDAHHVGCQCDILPGNSGSTQEPHPNIPPGGLKKSAEKSGSHTDHVQARLFPYATFPTLKPILLTPELQEISTSPDQGPET